MFGRKRVKPIEVGSLDDLKPLLAEGKPILLDFWQPGCRNCKIMDGIVNEVAEEYGDSARVVKVDVTRVGGAAQAFSVKATPTFLLLARPAAPTAKKKAKRREAPAPGAGDRAPVARWRASGMVRKDQMTRAMEGAGAVRVE
jgi:thiol-disulfide isomerase/thioredoxin